MKLTSNKFQVGTKKINANYTNSMIQDLSHFGLSNLMEYKIQNKEDLIILKKYFNLDEISDESVVYYIVNTQIIRKFKLLIIENSKYSIIINKIIDNSIQTNISDILEKRLSRELAKEIDINILKNLRKYVSGK